METREAAPKPASAPERAPAHTPATEPRTEHSLLRLQQSMGNQAVLRLLRTGLLQPKLTVNLPGDEAEQEAEQVAASVTSMVTPQPVRIQRQASGPAPAVSAPLEQELRAMQAGGQPLPESERAYFEPRFGRAFGAVRIHTDGQGAAMAESVGALAFTVGHHVVFGAGRFAPGTSQGRRLLAHELTHVVQQTAGGGPAAERIARQEIPGGEIPHEEITFEEGEPVYGAPAPDVTADQVLPGPSPFAGRLVAILPGYETVNVSSARYAISSDLPRARQWGLALFGAGSFVILQGPANAERPFFYTLKTDETVSWSEIRTVGRGEVDGHEVQGLAGNYHWERTIHDSAQQAYALRVLFTVEGHELFPYDVGLVQQYHTDIDLTAPERADVPQAMLRSALFDEIDQLIRRGETQEAADRLAELDENAFVHAPWARKGEYLRVLIEAWTSGEQERAVVEIFKSVGSESELRAAFGILRAAGRWEQLFADLDGELWSLLIVLGQKFGDPRPLGFPSFTDLLLEARLLSPIPGIYLTPDGFEIEPSALIQVEEAARGFIRFLGSTLEALLMLITEPGKVIDALGQLVKLIIMVKLADLGYQPAQEYVDRILRAIGQQVLYAFKGLAVAQAGPRVVERVKWALIWEIASWFVGVGEIRAVLQGAGMAERIGAIARLARVMARMGRALAAEQIGPRLERLARIFSRSRRALGTEENVLEVISHLPDQNVDDLGRVLEHVDIDDSVQDMARLQQVNEELGEVAAETLRQTEMLNELAVKAGGLTEEVAAAFGRLAGHPQALGADDISELIRLIPEGEGARFARALHAIPEEALAGRQARELLQLLAGSPTRMDALIRTGYGTFSAIYQRTGRSAATMDEYIRALGRLEGRLPEETRAVQYRQLLDSLEQGDTRSWIRLEDARRAQMGDVRLHGVTRVVTGDPRAEAGFHRLLRGRHDDLLSEIVDDWIDTDPTYARQLFQQIGDLTDEQAEGIAVVRYLDETGDIGARHSWDAFLMEWDPTQRNELLELVARVNPHVDSGLDLVLKRAFVGPDTNPQGTFGHLHAVQTLAERYPGARFNLELPLGRTRDVDIEIRWGGRIIDVEVKTYLGSAMNITEHVEQQVRRDLIRHLGDNFDDLLYLFPPQQSGNLGVFRNVLVQQLQHADVQAAILARGLNPQAVDAALQSRLTQLVDTFTY